MQHYIYTQAAVWIYVYLCLAQEKREKNFSTQLFKGPSCILQSGGTPSCAYFFLSLGSWLHHHALYTVCVVDVYILHTSRRRWIREAPGGVSTQERPKRRGQKKKKKERVPHHPHRENWKHKKKRKTKSRSSSFISSECTFSLFFFLLFFVNFFFSFFLSFLINKDLII